ncbi:porin family protein [Alloalcanivorax profundimaris]|uniref:porin family protein n=1 Tax=Alloalcanivorax profundimaris TaxID=2735259 RepID=UPI000C6B9EFE|nr:porin family protein [Alloalcanivorax profundimaris]MBF1801028.1 porin family protein [Alloalcanivorax profundimaris]MBU60442.1 hypothetical protein [Alcanivorax sp.]QJX03298.1 porin family protein [Alcanivorax sp. IO_7]
MKVKILGKVMVLSCSLVAGGAFAAGPYIGANYSQFQYDNDEYDSDTLKIDAAVLRAGIEFNDYIGLEARGGMGFEEDSQGIVDFELDNMYGGYVKLSAPLAESVHPYIIGGYTKLKGTVKAEGSVAGIDYSVDDDEHYEGESYGAGIDFNLTDTVGANLEYMRYYDQDEEEISGISVGLRSAF